MVAPGVAPAAGAVASSTLQKIFKGTSTPMEISAPAPQKLGGAGAAPHKGARGPPGTHRSPTTPPSTPQEFDFVRFPAPIQFDLGENFFEAKVDEGLNLAETFQIRFLGKILGIFGFFGILFELSWRKHFKFDFWVRFLVVFGIRSVLSWRKRLGQLKHF